MNKMQFKKLDPNDFKEGDVVHRKKIDTLLGFKLKETEKISIVKEKFNDIFWEKIFIDFDIVSILNNEIIFTVPVLSENFPYEISFYVPVNVENSERIDKSIEMNGIFALKNGLEVFDNPECLLKNYINESKNSDFETYEISNKDRSLVLKYTPNKFYNRIELYNTIFYDIFRKDVKVIENNYINKYDNFLDLNFDLVIETLKRLKISHRLN